MECKYCNEIISNNMIVNTNNEHTKIKCPFCHEWQAYSLNNYYWRDLAADLKDIKEKLDAVLATMPKCNCLETHVFNQSKQRAEWFCPIHGVMCVWVDQTMPDGSILEEGTTGGAP